MDSVLLVSHGQITFSIFFGLVEKRVWTSSQAALILTLPHGTGSLNKRNMMHTHLVAAISTTPNKNGKKWSGHGRLMSCWGLNHAPNHKPYYKSRVLTHAL